MLNGDWSWIGVVARNDSNCNHLYPVRMCIQRTKVKIASEVQVAAST